MNIISENFTPDANYFSMGDISPVRRGDDLIICNGRPSGRNVSTTSTIVINEDGFTAIHVGYAHKRVGGQGWFYYVDGQRKTWTQLSDDIQARVMDAWWSDVVPSWANRPGMLREKSRSSQKRIAYKIVEKHPDGSLRSVFDKATEYVIGKRLTQRVQPNHGGGYYAYLDLDDLKAAWRSGHVFSSVSDTSHYVLLEVELSGCMVNYYQKIAATHIRPIRILEGFNDGTYL